MPAATPRPHNLQTRRTEGLITPLTFLSRGLRSPGPPRLLCARCPEGSWETYPRGDGLQSRDVILQSQAAAVVEHGLHPGHVRLHQLLPLVGCFLLQGLHFLLEVLPGRTRAHISRGPNREDGAADSSVSKGASYFILLRDL